MDDREIFEGMIIEYKLRPMWGIAVQWQTEISYVHKPVRFVDRQRKGPYRLWEHTHSFVSHQDGILMQDHVRYRLPLGWLGRALHYFRVRKEIESIFAYRKAKLETIFPFSLPVNFS